MADITMPQLGETVTEGTITKWFKQVGDEVAEDEPLFEVSTDKVDTEVPSPVAGVLQSIKVQADETVEVGAELAVIGGGGGAEAKEAKEQEPAEPKEEAAEEGAGAEAEQAAEDEQAPEEQPAAEEKPSKDKAAARSGNGNGKAKGDGNGKAAAVVSPLVRRLAREHDVDLSQVTGSGSGGRVRREDVEAFVQQRGQEPAAAKGGGGTGAKPKPAAAAPQVAVPLAKGLREQVVPATRTRKVIAQRMVASLQVSAQLTSAVEIDMTRVMRLRHRVFSAIRAYFVSSRTSRHRA